MTQTVQFKIPVLKDQTVEANAGKIVEEADTVTVVVKNGNQLPTTQDIVVSAVQLDGKMLSWSTGTTNNLRPNDIIRVHAKHAPLE